MARTTSAPADSTPPAAPADTTEPAAQTEPTPAEGLVRVKLAHFLDHEGKSYTPGTELSVPKELADSWIWAGYARLEPESDPQS